MILVKNMLIKKFKVSRCVNFSIKTIKNPKMGTAGDTVLTEELNNKGIITLNKPKKLNSLDMEMISKIYEHLLRWKDTQSMVIIKGNGRAFCAGADVVNITKNGPKNSKLGKDFFRAEYRMNGLIGSYPIPYVALIDGITMGGGAGLSIHGNVRIATEKTLFSMPETAIGLFPDVGMTYILSRQPNKLGVFLGLTGSRLSGSDLVKTGIATNFTNSKNIDNIFKGLIELKNPKENLNEFLKNYTEDTNKLSGIQLTPYLKTVDYCFSSTTVEGIFSNLQKDGSEFATKTLETLKKMSPTSLKISLKALELAKNKNLEESLITENRLVATICDAKISPDFYEGVRAQLIDKDKKPKWNPQTLKKVTDNMIDEVFKPLSEHEELRF